MKNKLSDAIKKYHNEKYSSFLDIAKRANELGLIDDDTVKLFERKQILTAPKKAPKENKMATAKKKTAKKTTSKKSKTVKKATKKVVVKTKS